MNTLKNCHFGAAIGTEINSHPEFEKRVIKKNF